MPTVALLEHAHWVHASRLMVGPLASPSAAQALMEADTIVHLAGALRL